VSQRQREAQRHQDALIEARKELQEYLLSYGITDTTDPEDVSIGEVSISAEGRGKLKKLFDQAGWKASDRSKYANSPLPVAACYDMSARVRQLYEQYPDLVLKFPGLFDGTIPAYSWAFSLLLNREEYKTYLLVRGKAWRYIKNLILERAVIKRDNVYRFTGVSSSNINKAVFFVLYTSGLTNSSGSIHKSRVEPFLKHIDGDPGLVPWFEVVVSKKLVRDENGFWVRPEPK
jgi:hypothetical protein